jgi:ligand-binding SRPBCC domain-containing protein
MGRKRREFSLERRLVVPGSLEDVFAFFSDPRNLEAITPPELRFAIVDAPETLERGSLIQYRLRISGVPVQWLTEITEWTPPRGFADRQLTGPYPFWEHAHRFRSVPGGTEVYDNVRYAVPGGPLAPLVQQLLVAPRLTRIFDYRTERLRELLGR